MTMTNTRNRLLYRISKDKGTFGFHDNYPTYQAAVNDGKLRFGKGQFMVDTGGRVPTRDEQLLRTHITSIRKLILARL